MSWRAVPFRNLDFPLYGWLYLAQGYFELLMPVKSTEILTTDTTVEELANYISTQIKARVGAPKVTVYAYEGIGKGAIAER